MKIPSMEEMIAKRRAWYDSEPTYEEKDFYMANNAQSGAMEYYAGYQQALKDLAANKELEQ